MQKKNSSLDVNPSEIKSLAFKGSKALLLRHISGFLINFSGGIILARKLGPEILGLYFISYTLLIVFRQLIDFGISTYFIRLKDRPTELEAKSASTLQQFFALACLFITFLFIAPFAARWYGHEALFILISSAAIGAYFNSWQSIPFSRLERDLDYRKVGAIEISEILSFNIIAVAGAFTIGGVEGLAAGNVLRGLIPAALSIVLTSNRPGFCGDFVNMRSIAKTSLPLVGSNLVLWIIMLAPPVLIGSFSGPKELGIAQLAYNLLGNTMFIAAIFQRVSLTSLAKFQDDREYFNKTVQGILKVLFIVYIPLTMGIASFSPWWVAFIYGAEWAEMSKVILIAAVPVTMAALLSVLLSALLSKGMNSVVLKQNVIHAVLYWGVMGLTAVPAGAVSVPVSHLIAMSAGYVFISEYSRHCGVINYKPLLIGFVSGVFIMAISWHSVQNGYLWFPVAVWSVFIFINLYKSPSVRQSLLAFLKLR